ncbi:UbiX family flavin prenyltransferase [Candidatus Micrarchaeota archaeon]|nr:UbiX family flavin prenyltransferase [Candidatus Micrarchaeota archaeon]
MKLIVAVTGASGFPLAIEFLKACRKKKIETHLIVSQSAQKIREYETGMSEKEVSKLADCLYKPEDIYTRICSGSFDVSGMVVIPCSMKTLAHIANGIEESSITRAASVQLKSRRPLVLVPRETPLTLAHLRNLVKAKEIGCDIVPPMMCHYIKPKSVNEMEKFLVGRIFELLKLEHSEYKRWGVYE